MKILKSSQILIKFAGLSSKDHKSLLYKFYGFSIKLFIFLPLIPEMLFILSNLSVMHESSLQIAFNFELIMTLIKFMIFSFHEKEIFRLIDDIQINVEKSK